MFSLRNVKPIYLATGVVLAYTTKIAYQTYLKFTNINSNRDIVLLATDNDIVVPKKGSSASAGWDLYSNENCIIMPGTRQLISTGLNLNYLPDTFYLRIAPRSGLACRSIDIGAGVVDADYRGELKVLIINNSLSNFTIDTETRIAQLIPEYCGDLQLKVLDAAKQVQMTDSFIRQTRGDGGFGSTGK